MNSWEHPIMLSIIAKWIYNAIDIKVKFEKMINVQNPVKYI